MLNDLRSRIWVQTDGQLKTGRDVVVAALLGADEMGFATAPLIATGCVMMRACHLNTCPVGIATQDPELRARFAGTPEHVVNFFFFVAEEARRIMAQLGVRTLRRADRPRRPARGRRRDRALEGARRRPLEPAARARRPRRHAAPAHAGARTRRCRGALDWELIETSRAAIEGGDAGRGRGRGPQRQPHRRRPALQRGHEAHGDRGAAARARSSSTLRGSAGQSFGAWLAPGIELTLVGDANDYTGKGLSGGTIAVRPPEDATFAAEENVIVGNTVLYGATTGKAFFRGLAGERFAVRNSGVHAVVEGVGDHGCEYMTGGHVVVLGPTGRNFAAGMSGGIAYVLDEDGGFERRCNTELVGFDPLEDGDVEILRALVEEHLERTGSTVAARVLDEWDELLPRFVKVMPHDYKRALAELAAAGNGTSTTHDDHPVSTAGEGFVTTESEEAAERGDGRLMGELGAFIKLDRVENPERDPARARPRLPRVRRDAPARRAAGAGRALHGVRRPVLPQRLPAQQPDPGLERPRLPRPLARGDRAAPPHEQLPRLHRAASARRRARPRACSRSARARPSRSSRSSSRS